MLTVWKTLLLKSRMFCTKSAITIESCTRELESRFMTASLPEAICDIQYIIASAIGMKTVSNMRHCCLYCNC